MQQCFARWFARFGLTFARLWFKQRIRSVAPAFAAGGRDWLPEMMRPTKLGGRFCVASMAAMLFFGIVSQVRAENENFSNKPAPALFNADCTGTGCHKGPQGLGKGQTQIGLAGFLREHYTNSRESSAALAAYILKMPSRPAQPGPRAARAGNPRPGGARTGPPGFPPEP